MHTYPKQAAELNLPLVIIIYSIFPNSPTIDIEPKKITAPD